MDSDAWTHFAYRGDGETFEILVDGEPGVGPSAFYDGTLATHDTLFVGKQEDESWGGRIDEFRVYSRALSDEEIERVMSGDEDMEPDASFLRGDCNSDGTVNLTDAVCILHRLFQGAPAPDCIAATNVNGDATVNLTDPVTLLNALFAGGPAPVEPFPDCGPGMLPADEQLGCAKPPNCR